MSKKTICLLSLVLALGSISTAYGDVVYDFETGTQGWGGLKDGTAPTVSPETHSGGGSQSLRVTIDEAANGQQEGGWASPRDFTVDQANVAAGGFTTLSFWYRIDDPDFNAGNFVCHWISSTESWSGGGWYGNGLWGVLVADGQWHEQTFDLSILGQAAGGWQGTWGDQTAWEFRDDLRYSIEIAVSSTNNTTGSNIYIDDIKLSGASAPPSTGVVVGDFEGNLNGWRPGSGMTLSFGTIGATTGTQALQVDGPGGWHIDGLLDAKPHRALLGTTGAKVTADVTAFAADMTTPWMQVGMVVNAQNNNDAGANNNIGWQDLGSQDLPRDGQPHTLTWALSDALTAKIAAADDGIWWFELALISNLDGASVTKFYVDNIQVVTPAQADTGKSTDVVIGNWEQALDGWVAGGGADVVFNDHNGVTLGNYSLDVFLQNGGGWQDSILQLNVVDANLVDEFKANTRISLDITRLVADWPVDVVPQWNEIVAVLQGGGDGWTAGWVQLPVRAGWDRDDGDQTVTATWDYGPRLAEMNNLEGVTWMTLRIVSNVNSSYTGWSLFYLDNMVLSGAGVPLNPRPANAAVDVPIDSKLSWTAGAFATKHQVYFGTDAAKVRNANKASDPNVVFSEQTGTRFDPNGLAFRTPYYWRVDEVNEANPDSPWKGPVWNFATANFIVVDDFESYNDIDPPDPASHTIFGAWADGFGTTTNGAVVGNALPPYTERTVVHSGAQAMPLFFDNSGAKVQSEATRAWVAPQDWTINSFNTLTLYIHGSPANFAGQVYVIVGDGAGVSAKVTNPDSTLFTAEDWKEWKIPFDQLAGVNLAAVTKLVIGIADLAGQPEANGVLAIDDIRVYRAASGANLLAAGGFESGALEPWWVYNNVDLGASGVVVETLTGAAIPEPPKEGKYALHVVLPKAGANFWDAGLGVSLGTFEAGMKYTISVFLKSKQGTAQISIKPELGENPWTGYGTQDFTITDQWAEYSLTTPVFSSNVTPANLSFHIAFAACDFWVDGVRFYEGDYVPPPSK